MNIFEKIIYSAKTIYILTIGKWLHPQEYERYCVAYELIKNHPEWVQNHLK